MTVAVQALPITYNGNGTASPLAVPFRFLNADHLVVTRVAGGTRTVLVRGTDYSVAGADLQSGGTVTPLAAIPDGVKWEINRRTPREQPSAYPTGDDFPAATHERALDRSVMMIQEADQRTDRLDTRAVKALDGQTGPAFDVSGLADGDLLEFRGGGLQRFNAAPFAGKFYSGEPVSGRPLPASGTGADGALRADLASTIAGAALIAHSSGYDGANGITGAVIFKRTIYPEEFNVKGDYDPTDGTGTDDTEAIQRLIDACGSTTGLANFSTRVVFTRAYYKITAPLVFPIRFYYNVFQFNGSAFYYKGPVSTTSAVFQITNNQFTANKFSDLTIFCDNRAGHAIYASSGTSFVENQIFAIKNTVWENIYINDPNNIGVRWGDQTNTGNDMDGAHTKFDNLQVRSATGKRAVVLDADNNFNITFLNPFFGSSDGGPSSTYVTMVRGGGYYFVGLFTGDNDDDTFALDIRTGNVGIFGWNTEGGRLLETSGMIGDCDSIYIANVRINDGSTSAVPTLAISAPVGEIVLQNAKLGKSPGHCRNVYAGDTLHAINVDLGSNQSGSIFGRFLTDHPERSTIDGRRPIDVQSLGPNPNFHLWWGSGADHMPVGYEKSSLGTCTITRATSNVLHTQFSANVNITNGAAASGQFIDGIRLPVNLAANTQGGAKSTCAVVRGYVTGLTGTTTVQVRITYINAFNSPNGSNFVNVTPDADGNFIGIIGLDMSSEDPPRQAVISVGTGVAGATADIFLQTCHLIQHRPYDRQGGLGHLSVLDAWTAHPSTLDPVVEYFKAGVTARWNADNGVFVRSYLRDSPMPGRAERADRADRAAISAGGSAAQHCTTAGTVGSTAVFKDAEPVAA